MNASEPMLLTLVPIITLARLVEENASSLMLVTLFGIVMLVRLVQSANALVPMLARRLGSVTPVRLRQDQNV